MGRGTVSFKEVFVASRPLWWITMGAPFVVGALLAKHDLSLTFFVGAFYFLFPYNLLVYGVNDIYDYETDIRNERKSGVAHGKVLAKIKHASLWRAIIAINAPFWLYLAIVGNVESNVFLLMIIYMAFAYSVKGLRYKEIPFIDSITSSFHYTSPFIFGLLLFNSPDLYISWFAGFFLWAVGNHAFGAIQDIAPDREANIKSIATQLGATKTLLFCIFVYLLAVLAPLLEYGLVGLAAAAWVAPYLVTVLATWGYRKKDRAPEFRAAWRRFLTLNYVVGGIASLVLIYLYNN